MPCANVVNVLHLIDMGPGIFHNSYCDARFASLSVNAVMSHAVLKVAVLCQLLGHALP